MLTSSFYILPLLSACVHGLWLAHERRSDSQVGANGTDAIAQYNEEVSATLLNATKPSFEQLIRSGLSSLRYNYPSTELKIIWVSPLNRAPSASRYQDFRHVALAGIDTRRNKWIRVENRRGRDEWSTAADMPVVPVNLRERPSFLLDDFPITFQEAFRLARLLRSPANPFADVIFSAGIHPEAPDLGVSYFFVDVGHNGGILVGAMTGEVVLAGQQPRSESTKPLNRTLDGHVSVVSDAVSAS